MILQGQARAYTELILRPMGEWQEYPGQIDSFLAALIEFHGKEATVRFWTCTGPRNMEEIGRVVGYVEEGTIRGKEKALKKLLEACNGKEVVIEITEGIESGVVAMPKPKERVEVVSEVEAV